MNTLLKKEKQELEDMTKKTIQAFEEEKKTIFTKILTLKEETINLQVEQTTLQIKRTSPLSHVNSMSHLVQQKQLYDAKQHLITFSCFLFPIKPLDAIIETSKF
jgi:hypothetical protein